MKYICIIGVFLAFAVTINCDEVDWIDCGSDFIITNVDVENCTINDCSFAPKDFIKINVISIPDTHGDRLSLRTRGFVRQVGQNWAVPVQDINPCQHGLCPVNPHAAQVSQKNTVQLDVALRWPADVILQSLTNDYDMAICVQFRIDIV